MPQSFEQFKDQLVLVTGSTGFTGREVTKKLVAAGANVRAIVRPSSKLDDLENLDISWFKGDVFDAELVKEAAKHAATCQRSSRQT